MGKPLLRHTAQCLSLFLLLICVGCSTEVEVSSEKRARSENSAELEKLHTKVGVELLAKEPSSSGEEPSPSSIQINGNHNFAIVVEGDLGTDPDHRPSPPAKKSRWNTKIPWPTQVRGADRWTLSCYWAVWALIIIAIALMISTANRKEEGGPLWIILAMLGAAIILLQFLPHAESGIQFVPISPWSYVGWESFFVSLGCWTTILAAVSVVLARAIDAPRAFSVLYLIAMALNVLLSWSAVK